ncbi:MAG: NotI family restriction endonuclease [Acidobacteriota bacterium]|nr:NotI family restriction endonuclease [Acidobacteriota bacterium]
MSKIVELFGKAPGTRQNWQSLIRQQKCPFLGKRCYKVRKSDPGTSIGTCTVIYGREPAPILICPTRLIERRQIFVDCLHLLTAHQPGNELHIVSEVSIPGGSVDYFLVSARNGRVRDFVGIELQTLDTTGTVWPERQRLLKELNVTRGDDADQSDKTYGMNWKMTAKTILVQMHHKIQTFEHLNKKLALITQDKLLDYMSKEFNFGHLSNPANIGDAMHFHAYSVSEQIDHTYRLSLQSRLSTDTSGIAVCLGLKAEAKVGLEEIVRALQEKISPATLFTPM